MAPEAIEESLIDLAKDGKTAEVKALISTNNINLECTDENGMTPLMHAAYKGNSDMVELLLSRGANVNSNSHEHQYSALMFATLAGSPKCIKLLLENGADVNATNKVNRTASQLGAFVGRHECVSLINNYVDKKEIGYFSEIHGLEDHPKLEKHLVSPLHGLVVSSNLHPVKIILYLQENLDLIKSHDAVSKVLALKCERAFKQEVNEVSALKLHYQNTVLMLCAKWVKAKEKEGKDGITGLIKFLLKGRNSDGFQVEMENFIRDSIKRFEYPISNLFKQLVKTLASIPVGSEPTALAALTQAINGMQGSDMSLACASCGTADAPKKCSGCKSVNYCDIRCQKLHWFTHKNFCKELQNTQDIKSVETKVPQTETPA